MKFGDIQILFLKMHQNTYYFFFLECLWVCFIFFYFIQIFLSLRYRFFLVHSYKFFSLITLTGLSYRDCEIKINYSIYSSIFSCFLLLPGLKLQQIFGSTFWPAPTLTRSEVHLVKGKPTASPRKRRKIISAIMMKMRKEVERRRREECSGRSQTGAVEKENEKGAGQKAGQRHHKQKHTQGTEKVSEVGTKRGSSIDYCKNGLAFLKVSYLVRLVEESRLYSDTVYKGCHEVSGVNWSIGVCRGQILRK